MQKNNYRLFVIGVLCLLMSVGTLIGYRISKSLVMAGKNSTEGIEISKNEFPKVLDTSINVNSSSEKVNREYKIVKETTYTKCDHITSSSDVIIAESLDKAKETIDDSYKIVSEGSSGAVYSKKIHGYCPNHYIVTINDKTVVVYRQINDNEKEIYLNTSIPINILREDLLSDLKEGIRVDSQEKLNKIIQEIES